MKKTISVWIVNQYALPESAAGMTRHAVLARLMADSDIAVQVIAGSGHYWNAQAVRPSDSTIVSLPVAPSAKNGAGRVLNMARFSMLVIWKGLRSRRKPDAIIGSSPHLFGAFAAWILSIWWRIPFFLEVRDLWPRSVIELGNLSHRHPLVVVLAALERLLYRRARTVFTLLPGSERHIESVAGRGVSVVCVPNGVDAASLPPVRQNLEGAVLDVVYAGAHGVPNALETVLKAWRLVEAMPDMPAMHLSLIGDGKQKAQLVQEANTLGLRSVTFHEPVPKSDMHVRLAEADILVISWLDSPLYLDGISPNKLFDYMAAGRPVLMAVNTPRNPLQDAQAGLTVAPEDPQAFAGGLRSLAQMPRSERFEMGKRGRKYVEENFDLRVVASQISLEILNSVDASRA